MEEYIYVLYNGDWEYEKKYKYGYTKDPLHNVINSFELYSHLSSYIYLYKISKIEDSIMPYQEPDKIISIISHNNDILDLLNAHYNNNLKYLTKIKDYFIECEGSMTFIKKDGLNIFNNILMYDFNILGLKVEKVDIKIINNNINEKYKKYLACCYKKSEDLKSIISDNVNSYIKSDIKKIWNYENITRHLCVNNIHNIKDYNEYIKNNPELCMPANIFTSFMEFNWYNTYEKDKCPYYNKFDCLKNIKRIDYYYHYPYYYPDIEIISFFNKINNKIPNTNLWQFYGGHRYEFIKSPFLY